MWTYNYTIDYIISRVSAPIEWTVADVPCTYGSNGNQSSSASNDLPINGTISIAGMPLTAVSMFSPARMQQWFSQRAGLSGVILLTALAVMHGLG